MPLSARIARTHALLRLVPDAELVGLRTAIEAEMARREHGDEGGG